MAVRHIGRGTVQGPEGALPRPLEASRYDDYPAWVCADCGAKHGRRQVGVATWHNDTCDICGRYVAVTEPRDFGHLKDSWRTDIPPKAAHALAALRSTYDK